MTSYSLMDAIGIINDEGILNAKSSYTSKEPASDTFWYVSPINEKTDVVALTLAHGRQDDYSGSTFLLDLNTKEVTDEFSNLPIYSPISKKGFIFTGTRYGLYIDLEETAVGWFDNDRISILATNSKGENYLYLYSFVK